MSLPYCSLHKRLFSLRYHQWVAFPPGKIDEIRGYYALLRSTNADASFLEVIERACDQCKATFLKIARIKGKKGDPSSK